MPITQNLKYTALTIDNMSGGLADTGNPSVIDKNQSPCLYNVDFSRFGSVMARTMGDKIVGDENTLYGEVLALTKLCFFDDCDWSQEPIKLTGTVAVTHGNIAIVGAATEFITEIVANYEHPTIQIGGHSYARYGIESITDDLSLTLTNPYDGLAETGLDVYFIPRSPVPTGREVFIRGVANTVDGDTTMQFLDATGTWENFDTITGQHPFDIEIFNGHIYYSNGYNDLKFACVTYKDPDIQGCDVTVTPYYPTCGNQYGATAQTTTVVNKADKFITFGNGKGGPDLTALKIYFIANPVMPLFITTPDPNTPNRTDYTFAVNGVKVENDIIRWTTVLSVNQPLSGTFYDRVELKYYTDPILQTTHTYWYPTYCSSPDFLLAEGVKGYMLKVFDNRLFIAGSHLYPDMLAYSKKASSYSNEKFVSVHVGDFDVVGVDATITDSKRLTFTNACAGITALTSQGGRMYVHRITNTSTEIYQLVLTATDSSVEGYYAPTLVNSSSAASWFRNIAVVNDYQWYISTFYGIAENKQFGIFPTFLTPSTQDRSQNIRRTMSKMDFTAGAVAFFDRKIFYAGRYIQDDESKITVGECYQEEVYIGKPNDTLLVYDVDSQAFSIYKGIHVGVFYLTNNKLFYGSSVDAAVYELAVDQLVDKLTVNGEYLEIPSFFSWKRFNFNTPGTAKQLFRVYLDGYLAPGTEIEFGIIFDCNKQVRTTIKYDDIKKTSDCFGLDCVGIDCEGCTGKFNSVHFKKHIELNPIAQFTSMQPYIKTDKGFWQVDTLVLFANQLRDDDVNSMLACGAINAGSSACLS